MHLCAFWLNVFPPGLKTIHPTMSPRAILTGLEVDFNPTVSSSLANTSILTKSTTTQWSLALAQQLCCGQLVILKVDIILLACAQESALTKIIGPLSRYPALPNLRSKNSQRTTPRDWIFMTAMDARLHWITMRDKSLTKTQPTTRQMITVTQINPSFITMM